MQKFYRIISTVFMPLFMPTYGTLLLFQSENFTYLPPYFKWVTIGGTFLLTVIFPMVPILLMKRSGMISDLFISNREERVMPYLFTFLAYAIWTFFLWRMLEMPMYVVALALGASISIFLSVIINVKWKISAHMVGIGGLVGGVFGVCYRLAINPIWLFLLVIFVAILIGLARVEQKAHTPSQVLAGFILGFLSVFLCTLFFS
ncbi:phosphatase PAP2 family protein [Paludibacteraceae bacterium OttesenSCG-928-F17]|nr:phosphatase PAP2 family protein [Paludibacteraceae bacterium OttesenSCG-928-F17]